MSGITDQICRISHKAVARRRSVFNDKTRALASSCRCRRRGTRLATPSPDACFPGPRGGPSASTAAPDNAQERTLTRKGGVVTRERHDRFAPIQPALATCQLLLSAIAISLAMAVATLGVQAAAGQIQQVVGQLTEPGDGP